MKGTTQVQCTCKINKVIITEASVCKVCDVYDIPVEVHLKAVTYQYVVMGMLIK